jgi:hypothetical protein
MTTNLQLRVLNIRHEAHDKRKHFRYIVREQIKKLEEGQFFILASSCLHRNHLPLLKEYITVGNLLLSINFNRLNLDREGLHSREEIKHLKYIFKSHRKSITGILTSLDIDGYSPEVVEWLVMNKFWKPE